MSEELLERDRALRAISEGSPELFPSDSNSRIDRRDIILTDRSGSVSSGGVSNEANDREAEANVNVNVDNDDDNGDPNDGLVREESLSKVSRDRAHVIRASNVTFQEPMNPSSSDDFRPHRHVDYSALYEENIETFSCHALSLAVEALKKAGYRSADFVPKDQIRMLVEIFEERGIDFSNVTGFRYDAPDLEDTVVLLAKMQNYGAMEGMPHEFCTFKDITEDALVHRAHKSHRYDIGEWLEVRGDSMRWRLELIENVIPEKDDDGEEDEPDTFVYETSVDHKLTEHQVRWPREALRRIFGMSPWVWRQWACLRLEHKLRFQEGHPDDFETLDVRRYALDLWRVWLEDERNAEFRELYKRVGESGQAELVDHIMSPFDLMHEVITNRDDRWDLEDAGISIFTYVSLLGAGFVDASLVFCLQIAIPTVLFFYYTSAERNDDTIAVGTREVLFAIIFYYLFKLNRDIMSNFNHIAGITDTVNSRIQSLRKILWDNGDDSIKQSLGYTFDLFMNTGYICFLYIFNIWILYNVNDPFELLGSVIFFEFLFDLDEDIAASSWWDYDFRFLKAGVIGVILQNTIRKEYSTTRDQYIETMGKTLTKGEMRELRRRIDANPELPDDGTFLRGEEDDSEIELVTFFEMVARARRAESKATSIRDYMEELKPIVHFSLVGTDGPMFERHAELRAWSQWEELLFVFPTPTLVPANYEPGKKLKFDESISSQPAIRGKHALRYEPGLSADAKFRRQVCELLSCQTLTRGLQAARRLRSWPMFYSRLIHGVFAWTSYAIQLIFPFIVLIGLIMVYAPGTYCTLHLGTCEFAQFAF